MKLDITLSNGDVQTYVSEDIEEYDIIEMLRFDETQIETLLDTHAAKQAYWEALALKRKSALDNFVGIWYNKWWAHHRVFSKYVLVSYGEKKPTMEDIRDQSIIMFSEETTDTQKDKFFHLAFMAASKTPLFSDTQEMFKKDMFKYLDLDPPWYFETIERTKKKLEDNFNTIKMVAEKLNVRAFHMKSKQEFLIARKSNIGPLAASDKEVMDRINKRRP